MLASGKTHVYKSNDASRTSTLPSTLLWVILRFLKDPFFLLESLRGTVQAGL